MAAWTGIRLRTSSNVAGASRKSDQRISKRNLFSFRFGRKTGEYQHRGVGSFQLTAPSNVACQEHPGIMFREKSMFRLSRLMTGHIPEAGQRGFSVARFARRELAALQGASRILPIIRVIYAEVSFKPMYEGAPLYPEF